MDENATFEGGAHQHDEWGDRTEITIFDGDVVGKSGDWFHPTGAVVYPGTGKVQFVVTWEDAVALVPETRTLQWDMPGDERTTLDMYSHEFESSGDAYELEIGIPNNDPPHYDRTTWAFKIDGASHFTWTIFRGFECLPIDPPHYDAWKGETHRVLFDDTTTHSTTHAGVNSGTFYGFALPKNQTVPEGSGRLVVTMELDNERPIPQPLGLEYCPGISLCVSSYAAVWIRASEYTEETPNTRVYDLVVSPEAWDSPYNPTSTWRFRFFFDSQDPLGATEGYGSFQGTIHWVIEVYKLGS